MNKEDRLLRKAIKGNKNAFGNLVELYQDKILYLAFDYLGNYDDAKDVAQEVFLKAYNKLDLYEERSAFTTWLYRIAVNTCLDFLRKHKRLLENMEDNLKIVENLEDETSDFFSTDESIETAIKNLSKKQQTAIILKYFHDKSTSEISDILECDVNTVRVHIYRAIKKIKKLLNK